MSRIICKLCGIDEARITTTIIGRVVMCNACILLGVEAHKEMEESGTKPNLNDYKTFENKPASSLLILHTYFKTNPEVKIH